MIRIITVLLFISLFSFGQEDEFIDSLKTVSYNQDDSTKAYTYIRLPLHKTIEWEF